MKPENVGIENREFLITNMIEDCPARTVIRELLQNAIENTVEKMATGEKGRIEWFRFTRAGTPKLGLYNEGPGMDARELKSRMQIACSGKELGFNKNFGQGAKMSAGAASPYGLLYRSCKTGIVHEIWLQVEDLPDGEKRLVMIPQRDPYNDDTVIVRQVTDDAVERGRSLDLEWTEAILLGRSAVDNTMTGEFLGEGKLSPLWLIQAINRRYERFPEGITVRNATITTARSEGEHRNARGLSAVLRELTRRHEAIAVEHPYFGRVEIIYGWLDKIAKDRKGGPFAAEGIPGGSHICLVYRDEVYDFDDRWFVNHAGAYGFSGICEDFYVHIVLSHDAPVRNDNHRTAIKTTDSHRDIIECEDFCNLVRENRPQWVIEEMRARQDVDSSAKLQERMKKLAEQFKAKIDIPIVDPGSGNDPGAVEVDKGDGEGGEDPGRGSTPRENGRQTLRGRGKPQPRPRPETLWTAFKDKDLQPGWYEAMEGRAGNYDRADNTISLSREFCEYRRLVAWIDQRWPSSDENGIARQMLDDEYRFFAYVYGVGALSFRGDEAWTPDEWEKGLTQEAISTYMRDPSGIVEAEIKKKMHQKLQTRVRERAAEDAHA